MERVSDHEAVTPETALELLAYMRVGEWIGMIPDQEAQIDITSSIFKEDGSIDEAAKLWAHYYNIYYEVKS